MGTSIEIIKATIQANMKSFLLHQEYSSKPGLYAFALAYAAKLKEFGEGNRIIYIGKAEDSLKQRDLNTHFKDGRTGSSTLRRSIGAILKAELGATAFSRNGTLISPNIDNYKFNSKAETKLSQWMKENLLFGYWEYNVILEQKILRVIEEQLIIDLKPTLDLDKRTRKYNIHALALTALREKCKDEAKRNVGDQKIQY